MQGTPKSEARQTEAGKWDGSKLGNVYTAEETIKGAGTAYRIFPNHVLDHKEPTFRVSSATLKNSLEL